MDIKELTESIDKSVSKLNESIQKNESFADASHDAMRYSQAITNLAHAKETLVILDREERKTLDVSKNEVVTKLDKSDLTKIESLLKKYTSILEAIASDLFEPSKSNLVDTIETSANIFKGFLDNAIDPKTLEKVIRRK